MERTPPIPVELWEQIPPHVRAVLWVVLDRYEARIAAFVPPRTAMGHGGTRVRCRKTAATCRDLLAKKRALWTFVRIPEIDETNNAAERSLRHPVQWRKTSYGMQSECGSRFVESILTVLATCQRQRQNALAYLTACCRAFFSNTIPPALLPQPG